MSQTELSTIYDNASMVMILIDQERRVRKVNHTAVRFAQRAVEEMIGLYGGEALRCIHSSDVPRGCGFGPYCKECTVRRAVLDTFKTGKNHYQKEARLNFVFTEEDVIVLVSTTILSLEEGQRVLVCIEDITKRKLAEDELEKYREHLEERVEQRTAKLAQSNSKLSATNKELQESLAKVSTLSGLLPICAWCKKLRDDKGYWKSVEEYISAHTGAEFTHGMCPECLNKYFPEHSAEENGKENNNSKVN